MTGVPGSNLLKKAFKIIKKVPFDYYQFKERNKNKSGQYVAGYEDPVEYKGSIQPIPRRLYQSFGLDYKKNYIMIYSDDIMNGPDRDTSGDQIGWNSKRFQALDENDWNAVDGWQGAMFVEVKQ